VTREAARFIIAGVINTLLGYALYRLLLLMIPYAVAYTASYVLGIVASYSLNTWFVFRKPWQWKTLGVYPLVYAVQYASGILLLSLLIEHAHIPSEYAPLVVIVATLPVTFLLSRYLIKGNRDNEDPRT
jgi:putative flippase GtrA